MKKARNDAQTRASVINDQSSWVQYRTLRNEYNKKLNKAKSDSIRNKIIECIHDSHKLWKELKKMMNDNCDKSLNCMEINGILVTDKMIIADEFNKYVVHSIETIVATIPYMQFLPPVINDNIELWSEFELIDESVILKNT